MPLRGTIAALDDQRPVRVTLAGAPWSGRRARAWNAALSIWRSEEILAESTLCRVILGSSSATPHRGGYPGIRAEYQTHRRQRAGLCAVSKIERILDDKFLACALEGAATTLSAKIRTCAIRRTTKGSRSLGWSSSPRSWACAGLNRRGFVRVPNRLVVLPVVREPEPLQRIRTEKRIVPPRRVDPFIVSDLLLSLPVFSRTSATLRCTVQIPPGRSRRDDSNACDTLQRAASRPWRSWTEPSRSRQLDTFTGLPNFA